MRTESRRDGIISSISSRSMLLIIGIDLRLDVARHLRFIGKLHGFEEVRIDVGEIHLADRKSTRLNSKSLMRISYAVFCLKKKKKQQIIHMTVEYRKQNT